MEGLAGTSFDRYARYNYTYRVRTELLGPERVRILDVGDPYGTLDAIFPDDVTISVDLFAEGPPKHDQHQHVLGSGFQLPFPDGAFDLVTAHDVLEHVPADGRLDFMLELLRTSSGPVVVAAPFADPGTRACEDMVNSYYVAHVGHTLEPLDEHAENGLPELERIVAGLLEHDVDHVVYSDGWLYHWLAFMLLKAHYVSLGAVALDRATDAAFNRIMRGVDARPPHYRRALILRPPPNAAEVLGEPVLADAGSSEHEQAELEQLGWGMVRALPWREDPSLPGSALRQWIGGLEGSDALRTVASSLETVLDEARAALGDAPEAVTVAERPSVTAVVLDRPPEPTTRAVDALLAMAAVDHVVVCRSRVDDLAVPDDAEVIVVPDGDDAFQIATAAESISTEAILLVDPLIDFGFEDVDRLICAFGPARRCVGFHRPAHRVPAALRALRVEDGAALYVAREFMLVDLELYRVVGGLDGRFRGHLDDVDFGWRLNLLGHTVASVGPARWGFAQPSAVSTEAAVLWCWIKNLELPALEQVLARELLVLLGHPIAPDVARGIFEHFEGLLEARSEVAHRRIVDDRSLMDRFGELALPDVPSTPGFPPASTIRAVLPRAEPSPAAKSVLLVADDASQVRVAALAAILSAEVEVVVAGESPPLPSEAYATVSSVGPAGLEKLVDHADVLVMPAHLVDRYHQVLQRWDGVLVVDLAEASGVPMGYALARGDLFLCGSPHQRDHWLPQLLDLGRGSRTDDPADEVVRVVVTSSVQARRPVFEQSEPFVVAVDLEGLPTEDLFIQRVLDDIRTWSSNNDVRVDVLAGAVGDAATQERAAVIGRAAVVVRPTPDANSTRLATSAFSADALVLGVPLITTRADPGAWLVEERRAGSVVATDADALMRQVVLAATDSASIASWRAGAVGGGGTVHSVTATAPLVEVVYRPWRRKYAHVGGLVPLSATPAVRELLERTEVAVTASVTEALLREQAQAAEDLRLEERAVRARVSAQLTATEQALNEVRVELQRVRSHPVMRIASAARRLLRSG